MKEVSKEDAKRYIESKVVISDTGVPFKGVEVSHVGMVDEHGEPWVWEKSGEEYAIVSFKALSKYQFKQAVRLFKDGDYEGASNQGLSLSVAVDKLKDIEAGVTGTIILEEIKNKDGDKIVVVKRFNPAKAKTAERASLDSLDDDEEDNTSKKSKKDKKVKLDVAEVEQPKASKKDKKDKKEKSK